MLWALWGVLVLVAFGRPTWTSVRLLVDPANASGPVADHVRAQATMTGSWLEIWCALLALGLVGLSQLNQASLGLRRTARTPLIVGRGMGAGLAYLFIMSAASAMTASALSSLHLAQRDYPGAVDAARSTELTRAFLFGSVAAGIGEEILLFAIPIALARRSRWSPTSALLLVTGLRFAIHTYYGWGSLFVFLWIPAGYALYRAAGSIWPLIAAHAVYDGIQFSINAWPAADAALTAVNLGAALIGAAVLWTGYTRFWRDRDAGRRLLPLTV